jgi:hypothetical protein
MRDLKFEFLEDKIFNGKWLNDNHENYDFLEFWDKFYPNDKFEKVKKAFHYHMKKLVDCGMCKKSYDYLNGRDISNFGRRTIINYQPLIMKKQPI